LGFRELLSEEFKPHAILSPAQLNLLERHYLLLQHWNRTLNLTRIDDLVENVRFNYCESLFLGLKLPPGPLRIADVGSGAGFPGIPIAIVRPDLDVTLIEAHHRKAVFLREATSGVRNAQVFPGRAEACSERFDWIVSRAVSPSFVLALGLAPNCALLSSRRAALPNSTRVELPWGRDRIIDVPRGTLAEFRQ
jgi:16S rRNA (guanine527-N7)-methyltransferase